MQKSTSRFHHQISQMLSNWRALSDRQHREIEVFFSGLIKKPAPTLADSVRFAHLATLAILARVELLIALLVTLILAFGTEIFLPFDIVGLTSRTSLITVAMLVAVGIATVLVYINAMLHIRFDISLWITTMLHAGLSAILFALVEPYVSNFFQGYTSEPFWINLPPIFLLYAFSDLFIMWRAKKNLCFRVFRARHKNDSLETMIPPDKRGQILLISAADHYVDIHTENGHHMHRMTMKAAQEKAGPETGMRVHRSHWVAYSAMLGLEKEGERFFLTLRNGQRVPVSRNAAPGVRRALETL